MKQPSKTLLRDLSSQPASPDYFAELIENSSIGVYIIQDEIIRYGNPQAAAIFGYDRDELIGKSVLSIIIPEQRDLVRENLRRRIEGEVTSLRYVFTGLRKDGGQVEVEVFGSRITYEGRPAVQGMVIDISERKRVQELLAKEELKYRTLVQFMNEGLVQVDNDDVIQFMNDRFCEMSGYTREELLGKRASDAFIHDEDRQVILEKNLSRTLGTRDQYEIRIRKKSQEVIWVHISGSPVTDSEGKVIGSMGVLTDISEQKRMEQEIIRRRDFFRRVIDLNPSFIFAKNRLGQFTLVNQAVAEAYGTTVQNLIGKTDADFNPNKEEVEHFLKDDLHVMDSLKERFIEEEKITDAAGNVRWLQTIKIPLVSSDGKADQILGVSTDITGRRRAEIALRESESRKKALIEALPDLMFVLSKNGTYIEFKATNEEDLAIPALEIVGKNIRDAGFTKKYLDLVFRHIDLAITEKTIQTFEFELATPRGNRFWEARMVAMSADEVLTLVRDITERRQMEEDRRKLEAQLLQSQKMESVGTLAAGIAHNFNNIMAIILGYASLLKKVELEPSKVMHSADAICKAVERGTELVRELTTFARKSEPVFESIDVNALVTGLSKMLKDTFPESITFKVNLSKKLPSILGDHNQLHQAVLNLCVNARDAMSGGGVLTISTDLIRGIEIQEKFPAASESEYVRIGVTDTGIGMGEGDLKRIFEPFYTTKEVGKGTGLGLAVVYGIIEYHRGFMDVKSKLRKGSTFYLYLPCKLSEQAISTLGDAVSDEIPGGKETVLLVEDEDLLLQFLKYILEMKGYTTLLAKDGVSAVEVFEVNKDHIDLVLTDVGLPKRSGWDVFRMMREMDPGVKVILASGYLDFDLQTTMEEMGASDFIQKPYNPDDILRRVRNVLDV
jgi:PAS domain S-box-containing protein